MGQYDRQIKTAKRLIAKYGQAAIWRQVRDTVEDENEPWKVTQPETPTEHPVSIAFLPIDRQTYETFSFMKGTEIEVGSVMGLMGQVDFTPDMKDVVIRGGVEHAIETIDVLSPNGQKILYTVVFKA